MAGSPSNSDNLEGSPLWALAFGGEHTVIAFPPEGVVTKNTDPFGRIEAEHWDTPAHSETGISSPRHCTPQSTSLAPAACAASIAAAR